MSIITISRGSLSTGKEFAINLAKKLGYRCVSREDLIEEAINNAIPVGKLQTAMVKPPRVAKRLGPERELYLSLVTSLLCDYALKGDIVYHGYTGHLLLPGVPHIFKIRIMIDMEHRIKQVMQTLKLSQAKAKEYIENVDADRDKWVRFLYGVNWLDPSYYDLILNLAHMEISNTTTALCSMAQLPEFTLTPSAISALKNLRLSSRAKFLLGLDRRTGYADFKVTAYNGAVQVTYMPHHAEVTEYIKEVLQDLEGCREVNCTIAGSKILWLGERFDIKSELFGNLVKVAKKWDAAVEVMKFTGEDIHSNYAAVSRDKSYKLSEHLGGIEDDTEEVREQDVSGVSVVLDEFMKEGCSGGSSTIYGERDSLLESLKKRSDYSLLVIGDLYLDKLENVRKRLMSEFRSFLTDSIKIPVVEEEELKKELKSNFKVYLKLGMNLSISILLFIAVFLNQEPILRFMAGEDFKSWRFLAILILVLFVPVFAYSWGSTTRQILKFFRLD